MTATPGAASAGRTIAKNATVLMAAQLATWLLTLVLTIFLPRYLGPANLGKLNLASSIWAIVAVFVTFGMDTLLTKEIARAPERAGRLFGNTLVIRFGLHLLGYGAVAIYLWVARERYPADMALVAYLVGISSLVWQFISAAQAVLQGTERMEFISIANVAGKAVNTLICILVLLAGFGIYAVALVAVLASIATLAIELIALSRLVGPPLPRFDVEPAKHLLRAGVPYFLSAVFLVLYMQVDIVIISLLVDETAVGWYGVADQLMGTFLFIPTVFITAIFPSLSRRHAEASDSLPRLMQKSWDLLLLLAIPIGLGLVVIARPLVVLLFGVAFTQAGPILALMGVALILIYQNVLLGQFLIATDRQNSWTIVMAVTMVLTIVLDFIFVPWCQRQFGNGAMGGAMSFIVTEFAMNVIGIRLLPRGALGRANVRVGLLGLVAGAAMAAAAWPLRNLFILLPVLAGAVVYLGAIALLRVLPPEDWQLVGSLLGGIGRRLRSRRAAVR